MKLTEEKLKQMIAEELRTLNELDPFGVSKPDTMPQTGAEKAAQGAPEKDDPTKSLTQLKKDLLDASRNITNVKGLDPREIELISALLGLILQVASQGSTSAILQRVYKLLGNQVK